MIYCFIPFHIHQKITYLLFVVIHRLIEYKPSYNLCKGLQLKAYFDKS